MILVLEAVYIAGAIFASVAPNPILLIIARIFLGFAVGGSSQTIPVYVAEIAPAEGRGYFVTTFNVAIGLGIVTADIVGASLHYLSWRWMIGAAAVPAAVFFLCSLRLPESPRWLVHQNQVNQAREALSKVRPKDTDLDGEIGEMQEITNAKKKRR